MNYLDNYLRYLRIEKRASEHTIKSYALDLNQFDSYLKETYEIQEVQAIKAEQVRSWLVHLLMEKKTERTINRKLSSLRAFFKFCIRRGWLEQDPSEAIDALKQKKSLPRYVRSDHLDQLFDEVEFGDDFEGQRNRLMLELLYLCGLRRSELLGLDVDSFDAERLELRVMGKGGKERMIPLDRDLANKINAYVKLRYDKFGKKTDLPLFILENGNYIYPKFVYNLVKKHINYVSTIEKASPHILRHSFATHMSNAGADILALKELLGHSSLAATQIYTSNSIEILKEIHKKAHPLSEKKEK